MEVVGGTGTEVSRVPLGGKCGTQKEDTLVFNVQIIL